MLDRLTVLLKHPYPVEGNVPCRLVLFCNSRTSICELLTTLSGKVPDKELFPAGAYNRCSSRLSSMWPVSSGTASLKLVDAEVQARLYCRCTR